MAVKRPARVPAALYCAVPGPGDARAALRPRAKPACGGLSGALAISRASGDVDAMLKSLCVGRVRTYQTRSWFWFSWSGMTSVGGSGWRDLPVQRSSCRAMLPSPGGPRIGTIRGARLGSPR